MGGCWEGEVGARERWKDGKKEGRSTGQVLMRVWLATLGAGQWA